MLLNMHKTKVNIGFFYTIVSKIERIHYYFWIFFYYLAIPLHSPSNAYPDIGSVGRIEKKNLKENHKKSRNSRPWYPRTTLKVNIHIFGLTKCTIYCKKMFMFLFLFFSMVLLSSFLRLKELLQVKNGVSTSLLFFF